VSVAAPADLKLESGLVVADTGTPWFDSGRWMSREAQHREAWNSVARPKEDRGKPFKLDVCRTWIRLHFWAVHDVGLGSHKSFMKFYVTFLAYFIQIYEEKASAFTQEDSVWCTEPARTKNYNENEFTMTDIAGIH
jgi:hypothetical protein